MPKQNWLSNSGDTLYNPTLGYLIECHKENNSIIKYTTGWWFWDETGVDAYGPFETLEECERKMREYAATL
jgi:hypothetical protein